MNSVILLAIKSLNKAKIFKIKSSIYILGNFLDKKISEDKRMQKMSDINTKGEFTTRLRSETFLRVADNSIMGVLIIQRGFLKYFNKRFTEIFGYTKDDILKWKKREFYKIVYPDDLPYLVKNFKIEDDKKTVSVRFKGVRKDKIIIPIENHICNIEYNNKSAYLSSYIHLREPIDEIYSPKSIRIKEEKKIALDYHPNMVKILEDNNIEFTIIKHCSYREEKQSYFP